MMKSARADFIIVYLKSRSCISDPMMYNENIETHYL